MMKQLKIVLQRKSIFLKNQGDRDLEQNNLLFLLIL